MEIVTHLSFPYRMDDWSNLDTSQLQHLSTQVGELHRLSLAALHDVRRIDRQDMTNFVLAHRQLDATLAQFELNTAAFELASTLLRAHKIFHRLASVAPLHSLLDTIESNESDEIIITKLIDAFPSLQFDQSVSEHIISATIASMELFMILTSDFIVARSTNGSSNAIDCLLDVWSSSDKLPSSLRSFRICGIVFCMLWSCTVLQSYLSVHQHESSNSSASSISLSTVASLPTLESALLAIETLVHLSALPMLPQGTALIQTLSSQLIRIAPYKSIGVTMQHISQSSQLLVTHILSQCIDDSLAKLRLPLANSPAAVALPVQSSSQSLQLIAVPQLVEPLQKWCQKSLHLMTHVALLLQSLTVHVDTLEHRQLITLLGSTHSKWLQITLNSDGTDCIDLRPIFDTIWQQLASDLLHEDTASSAVTATAALATTQRNRHHRQQLLWAVWPQIISQLAKFFSELNPQLQSLSIGSVSSSLITPLSRLAVDRTLSLPLQLSVALLKSSSPASVSSVCGALIPILQLLAQAVPMPQQLIDVTPPSHRDTPFWHSITRQFCTCLITTTCSLLEQICLSTSVSTPLSLIFIHVGQHFAGNLEALAPLQKVAAPLAERIELPQIRDFIDDDCRRRVRSLATV